MMWLGRTEIRIASPASDNTWKLNHQALDAAMLMGGAPSPRAKQAWQTSP